MSQGEKTSLLENPRVQQEYPPADPENFIPHAANVHHPQDNPPAYDAVQVGYQPRDLPQQPANPDVYMGHQPQQHQSTNSESDKYLMIGAILGIASLVLTGFLSLICTVPLLICAVSTLQSKDKDKRLHCSKLSICGGVYAICGGCIFVVLIGVIYGVAIALNNSTYDD